MSGVAILRALLAGNAALLAAVPATRIQAGVLPQGIALPAVGLVEVSAVEIARIDASSPTTLVDSRVQVSALAGDYPTAKQVLALARVACNYQRGVLATYAVVSVRRLANGPDFTDPESGLCMQSVDFSVIYEEPNS